MAAQASGRRWLMLALGTGGQAAACVFVYGVPYLIPELRSSDHLTLAEAGLVVACPTAGLVAALYAWGAAADRFGERRVLATGLLLAAAALLLALAARGPIELGAAFVLTGLAGASAFASSGRLVMGWFGAEGRGLAMGVRQTSTPLGMAIAALAVPPLAHAAGVRGPLLFAAAITGVMAVLIMLLVVDPPRTTASGGREAARPAGSPYRTPTLWRVHAASALLVWPQFTVGAFGLVFLVYSQHLTPTAAGRVMAAGQIVAVLMRIGVGRWSDHVGSRLRPVRQLGAATSVVMAALAGCAAWSITGWIADPLLILACGLTSSDNGLAFTSVAELAGTAWSGRALGAQNTGQNLVASIAPPVVGALIGGAGYAAAFLLAAAFAIGAVPVTPLPETGPAPVRSADPIR